MKLFCLLAVAFTLNLTAKEVDPVEAQIRKTIFLGHTDILKTLEADLEKKGFTRIEDSFIVETEEKDGSDDVYYDAEWAFEKKVKKGEKGKDLKAIIQASGEASFNKKEDEINKVKTIEGIAIVDEPVEKPID